MAESSFRILVADDEPGVRLAIRDYLELAGGYRVATARDGQEAIEVMEAFHPQLLLLDINMPRRDGYEVVKRIRQDARFRHIPIVFLTHMGTTQDRIRGYEMGCDVYLPKPFDLEELAAVVQTLVRRWQAIQSEWKVEPSQTAKALPQDLDLTEREAQVLEWLSVGMSNGEIGQKLFLSPRTVEKYVSRLLRKTETNNRAELIRYALTHHLVE